MMLFLFCAFFSFIKTLVFKWLGIANLALKLLLN